MNKTAPTMSAAAHTATTSDKAAIAAAMKAAAPKNASRPATLNRPAPIPACLADSWNSFCANRISSRTSRETCDDSWLINSPIDGSAARLDSTLININPCLARSPTSVMPHMAEPKHTARRPTTTYLAPMTGPLLLGNGWITPGIVARANSRGAGPIHLHDRCTPMLSFGYLGGIRFAERQTIQTSPFGNGAVRRGVGPTLAADN